jgi:pyruvate/2-oxoglutarate dehydrogenase complex dihydrolipoamide acyltransferase (E2) component
MRGVHAALHYIAATVVVVGVVVSVGVVIVIGVEAGTEREAAVPEIVIMKSAVVRTAELTAVEAVSRGHAANHGAATETAATKTASMKSAAAKAATMKSAAPAKAAAAMATAAAKAAAAMTAAAATSTSQRHRRRSQANGGNSQQRNHCLAKHKHSPSNISLQPSTLGEVATVLENRYRLLPQFRATLIKLNVRKGGRIRATGWLVMTVDYVSFTNFANASA